jgi:4-hydroxy-tetrahydrodipicolinate synthase
MFHGSIVALVTPMTKEGNIDTAAFARLVEWHIAAKTDGIVVGGSTGESATLTFEEKRTLFRIATKVAADRIPIIAGTGTNSTASSIELTRMAMETGVSACLLVTPYYNKPTQEGLYQHFHAVARAVPIPQILYNVPGRTACDLLPDTVRRLAEIPNIIGIKESTGSVERAQQILTTCPEFDVYSGEDHLVLDLMQIGAKGNISVTANVAPEQMYSVCLAARTGNFEEAQRINMPLIDLHKNLFIESNPIPVKWALHKMGMIEPIIRLPLTPLSEIHHSVVLDAMLKAGISCHH